MLSLIFGLFVGAISVIFALQNVFPVTITFLAWDITASLALVIAVSILMGLVIAVLLTLPESIRRSFVISRLQKENQKLKDDAEVVVINTAETVVVTEPDPITVL